MKQKVLAGGGHGQAGQTPAAHVSPSAEESRASRQIALMAIWAFIGLLVPRAGVYGDMAPFGVGVAAAVSGPGAPVVYLATVIGYLLPGGTVFPLRYLAAVLAAAGIRWALSGLKGVTRHAVFAPLIGFLATLSTGLALSMINGSDVYRLVVVVCESLLAGGFAYFACETAHVLSTGTAQTRLTAQEQSSVVITGAVVLTAVAGIEFSGISPGRILAVMVILLLARCGKEQGGCIAGVVLGLAMALSNPEQTHLAVAFAFGGLMAGLFARFGRFASTGAFLAANTVVLMSAGATRIVLIGAYEVAAATILFMVLPPVLDRKVNAFFNHAREMPAVEGLRRSMVMRLDFASQAMQEVAETVDAVSHKLSGISAPDLGTVYRNVSDDICRVCGLRMFCWENAFSDTMSSFNDMTPYLRQKGEVTRAQVSGHLARHCGRLEEVVRRVNAGYREYLVREGAWRRLGEIRAVVTDQFAGMADLLEELSADFSASEQVDAEAASRVLAVCEQHDLLVQDVVCRIGKSGRMTVELLTDEDGGRLEEDAWCSGVGDACGREFDHPVVTRVGGMVKVAFTEMPVFTVSTASAQLNCANEKLCGDAFEIFHDGNGRLLTVLSDGMGSGGRAAVDGAMAAGLTSRLLRAGFGEDSVLRMVNSALMVKSGDESLSTLDIAAVDLFTGRLECRKAGAAVSLLRSMGRVSRVERSSLPLGILRDISFETTHDTLVDGDILLLLSDGVTSNGIGWAEEMLRDFDARGNSLKRLTEEMAATARQKQKGEREDDITIVAMQVRKIKRR